MYSRTGTGYGITYNSPISLLRIKYSRAAQNCQRDHAVQSGTAEDGFVYEGDMVVGAMSGRLHRKAIGKEQFLYADLFFLANEPPLKMLSRRVWVSFSFIPYLLDHSGTFLELVRAKLRLSDRRSKQE